MEQNYVGRYHLAAPSYYRQIISRITTKWSDILAFNKPFSFFVIGRNPNFGKTKDKLGFYKPTTNCLVCDKKNNFVLRSTIRDPYDESGKRRNKSLVLSNFPDPEWGGPARANMYERLE